MSLPGSLSGPEQSTGSASTNISFWNSTQVLAVPEGCVGLQFSEFVPWDNPGNLITLEVEEIISSVITVGFLNVLFFISAPTNILNMVVFTKQGLKERINLCLFFQSLADLVYMTENFLMYADRIYATIAGTKREQEGTLAQFFLNNYLLGFMALYNASGFMTMVIASERCLCVLSPLRAQRILKTKSMLFIILIAFFVIVGGFFPVSSRWSITCMFDPGTNSTFSALFHSQFYLRHKALMDTLDVYVYGLTLPGLFTSVVSVMTTVTVMQLRKMTSWREKTSSVTASVRDVALTRMLIGISLLFVVCTLPTVIVRICIVFVPDFSLGGRYHNIFNATFNVVGLFGYINSSLNFFVFYSLGTKYKETLSSVCGRKKLTKLRSNHTDETGRNENITSTQK